VGKGDEPEGADRQKEAEWQSRNHKGRGERCDSVYADQIEREREIRTDRERALSSSSFLYTMTYGIDI